jgi:hypothetical protein
VCRRSPETEFVRKMAGFFFDSDLDDRPYNTSSRSVKLGEWIQRIGGAYVFFSLCVLG